MELKSKKEIQRTNENIFSNPKSTNIDNIDDIKKLMNLYRNRIYRLKENKTLSDNEKKFLYGVYNNRLNSLKLQYAILISNINQDEIKDKTKVKELAHRMLSYLGFNCETTIYGQEVDSIVNRYNNIRWGGSEKFNMEIFCAALIYEILMYYNVKFDLEKILKTFNVDNYKFRRFHLILNKWCNLHHWKKEVSLWQN